MLKSLSVTFVRRSSKRWTKPGVTERFTKSVDTSAMFANLLPSKDTVLRNITGEFISWNGLSPQKKMAAAYKMEQTCTWSIT